MCVSTVDPRLSVELGDCVTKIKEKKQQQHEASDASPVPTAVSPLTG